MSMVMILKSISKKTSTTRRNDIDEMNDKERNVYILDEMNDKERNVYILITENEYTECKGKTKKRINLQSVCIPVFMSMEVFVGRCQRLEEKKVTWIIDRAN